MGVKRGTNCKVQDKDAGYAFDLTPLAEHKWGKNDSYLLQANMSVYSYQLKVRFSLFNFLNSPFSIVYKRVSMGLTDRRKTAKNLVDSRKN